MSFLFLFQFVLYDFMGKRIKRTVNFCLVFSAFFIFPWSSVYAKLPEPDDLLRKMVEVNENKRQFKLDIQVRVFDPEAFTPLNQKQDENIPYYENITQSYQQTVVWIRDEFLGIETSDQTNNPLHVYLEQYEFEFSENLQQKRRFSTDDILFPPSWFYTKHYQKLKKRLAQIGIIPEQVNLIQHGFRLVFKIGNGESYLLVDPETFGLVEMNYLIEIGGNSYPVRFQIQEWDRKNRDVPLLMNYYINSRLFKEIKVVDIRFRGNSAERRKFLKKYRNKLLEPTFSLETNYAL